MNKETLKKLNSIFRFVWPYKGYFLAGLLCLFLSSLTLSAFPYAMGKLVDAASTPEGAFNTILENIAREPTLWLHNKVNQVGLALLIILLLQGIFSFLRVYLFAIVSEKTLADIRLTLYKKLITLPLLFYDKKRIGELTSRITTDVALLQNTLSLTLAELFRQVATLIIGIGILFYTIPHLTLFMLSIFPLVVFLVFLFGHFIRKLSKKTQDELAGANVIVEETLQAIHTVKAFTNELFEVMRYNKSLQSVIRTALKAASYRGGFISFIIVGAFGCIVAVMWYGAILVQKGSISVGDLLSFILYTTFIGGSLAGLGDIFSQVQKTAGASDRIMEIIHEKGETELQDTKEHKGVAFQGNIQYKAVHFAYPTREDVKVLNNLSFEVKAGEKVALVGPSGAGKSTIIQLLMRFYDSQQGTIKIDGQDIRTYSIADLRKHIGIVPQEVILLGGTIRENIAYGKPGASEEEIRMAARKANALAFIKTFPEKFDTVVGERGVKLSGGQRQRIAIARAILKNPTILVLDEATSSLDAAAEVAVQQALDELMKDRTTIIIAHRLATVRKADSIYVLQEGSIVESGKHEQLVSNENGVYSKLVKLQFELPT